MEALKYVLNSAQFSLCCLFLLAHCFTLAAASTALDLYTDLDCYVRILLGSTHMNERRFPEAYNRFSD